MISKELLQYIWLTGFQFSLGVVIIFCTVALVRRYWLLYWAYVDDGEIYNLPDDFSKDVKDFDTMWNNNSPWTILHICVMLITGAAIMIFWPLVVPFMIFAITAETHRKYRRERKKFEAELKGTTET